MRKLLFVGISLVSLAAAAGLILATARPADPGPGPKDALLHPPTGRVTDPVGDVRLSEWSGRDDSDTAFGVRGTIGYTVRDGHGRVKHEGVVPNAVNNEARNEVFNRIALGFGKHAVRRHCGAVSVGGKR